MTALKGLYAECIRLEEKLFKFIEQDLLSARLVHYVYVITQCKHMIDVNKANYIYKEFILADLNGDDWRTNKFISQNIDNIINDGTQFNTDIKKLLQDYLHNWDMHTKLLEKYIDQIFIIAIKDTINSDKSAEDILHNLKRLEKLLLANKNDMASLYMKTTKDIKLLGDSYVENVLNTSYRYIKEKEKEIFVWRTDDESWWNTALDANIVSLASELSPNGKHMKLNRIINGSLVSKLAEVESELNKQSYDIKPVHVYTEKNIHADLRHEDDLLDKLAKDNSLGIKKIGYDYAIDYLQQKFVKDKPELLAKMEKYSFTEKEDIKELIQEQDKLVAKSYVKLALTVMSAATFWINPMSVVFMISLLTEYGQTERKKHNQLIPPKNIKNLSLFTKYTFLMTREGQGFIKLPKSNHGNKYYSFEEILMSEDLQKLMEKEYKKRLSQIR